MKFHVDDTVEFLDRSQKAQGKVSRVSDKRGGQMVSIKEPSSISPTGFSTFVRYADCLTLIECPHGKD